MPTAINVTPKSWTDIKILYDDGKYSVIWGRRDNYKTKELGVRWNGSNDAPKGYPNQGKYSLWYSEPKFLFKPILDKLLTMTNNIDYVKNIKKALLECEEQGTC